MRGQYLLAELQRHPLAILPAYAAIIARVANRISAGLPISGEDQAEVEAGKDAWAARRSQSGQYAGGSIAVVPVYGVLTQRTEMLDASTPTTSTSALGAAVRAAAADPSISAIVLDVDSPGGSVGGLDEFAQAIYQARGAKPVAAVANSLAASAAYWAASQAGELYAAPGALVGSIGVYSSYVDQSAALKSAGLSVELISAGQYKTEALGMGPLTDEARAHLQSMVDDYYDAFVRAVGRGRGASLKAVKEGMGGGRVMLPDQAKAAGMIDGTATLGEVIGKLQARLKRSAPSALARARNEIELLG